MAQVRQLRMEDDLRDLVALSRVFFAEYEEHHPVLFQVNKLSEEQIIEYFHLFVESDDRAAFVARQSDRIVGYITTSVQTRPAYWRVRRLGHVSGLMVAKAHRRRGIGSELLSRAEAYFRQQGALYYTVYTAVANAGALAFYEGRGMDPLCTHLLGEMKQGP